MTGLASGTRPVRCSLPQRTTAAAVDLEFREQSCRRLSVAGTPGLEFRDNFVEDPRFEAHGVAPRRRQTATGQMMRAAHDRHRLLESPRLEAAAGERGVKLFVWLAARLLDHLLVDFDGLVELPVLDARLDEAGVDVNVRLESVGRAGILHYGESLVELPCSAHELHGDAQSVIRWRDPSV